MSALRAVDDAQGPKRRRSAVKNVSGAASSGSRRDLLVALRDQIAGEIDAGVPPRDLASLSLRLLAISESIAEIDAAEDGDDVGKAAAAPDEVWPAT